MVISDDMVWVKFLSTSCEIYLRWMPQNLTNEETTQANIDVDL